MLNNNLEKLVYAGEFNKAIRVCEKMSIDEIYESIRKKAYKESDIVFYGFFVALLINREIDELSSIHYNSAVLLSNELCVIDGAYDLASYHVKEALRLDSENEQYQKYLRHLESIPR